jgi:hypothetical protein
MEITRIVDKENFHSNIVIKRKLENNAKQEQVFSQIFWLPRFFHFLCHLVFEMLVDKESSQINKCLRMSKNLPVTTQYFKKSLKYSKKNKQNNYF